MPPSENLETERQRKILLYMVEKSDIKQNSDLIDTELIQISITGYDHPLHIYTMDDALKIKIRLHIVYCLFKIIIQEAKNTLDDLGVGYKDPYTIDVDKIKNPRIFNIDEK